MHVCNVEEYILMRSIHSLLYNHLQACLTPSGSGESTCTCIHAPLIKAMLMNNAFHEVGVYCRGVYIHV